MYASDVTRTFPIGGRFTARQREIYDVVLEANRAALAATQPGNHWNDPHDAAVKTVTRGLRDLGILRGRMPTLLKELAYREYFMHKTGHWLGMDVHDVGDYKLADDWRLLEPGMVMTIEPGIYVAAASGGPARPWRGIGVRIEDDVVVTRDGAVVLTEELPAAAEDVERCMAAGT
jgi:Xaa-Pro aminopeptidase